MMDETGFWVTHTEGGEWFSVGAWQLDYARTGQLLNGKKVTAIGIRLGGQDRVFDLILGRWRDDVQTLPPEYSSS
jgi:hypothetical protein